MNRLTFKEPNGKFGVVEMNDSNYESKLNAVVKKLMDYENSELTPDEVSQLKQLCEEKELESIRWQEHFLTAQVNCTCLKEELAELKEKYEPNTNTFAGRMRKVRQDKKFSQAHIANKIGVNRMTIVKWEKGTSEPKIHRLRKMAKYFNVKIEYLLGDE